MSLLYLLTVHLTSCLYWAVATREAGTTLDDLGCDPAVSPLVESWGVCPELRDDATPLTDMYFHSFYIAAVIMKGSNYPAPLETPSKGAPSPNSTSTYTCMSVSPHLIMHAANGASVGTCL